MPFLGSQPAEVALTTGDLGDNIVDGTKTKDALIGDYSDVTITASDLIMYGDATDSNNTKRDTVQGILDLASGGLVKQMQTVAITGTDSTTSTSRDDITDFTLTVTSLISSDKVLLTGIVNLGTNQSDYASFIHLDRGGTEVGQGAAASSRRRVHSGEFASNNVIVGVPISFVDSPSATGNVVYKVQFSTETGSTTYVNRSGSDADSASKARSVSTLTALVIDGS